MKRPLLIGWALLLALAACHRAAEAPEPAEIEDSRSQTPSPALSAIDSLMWQQPDSAFVLLQEFAASPKADSLNTFGGHYFQVLLSELLYKNDYAQTNRFAMQQAVAYFDSLTPALNDDLVFLDARAHYINGVGYYERDSVVEACREYIKALETMEGHFKEKDLVGRKAKFMAYTYNRLGDMFSDQFMMENCILCYNNAPTFGRISESARS